MADNFNLLKHQISQFGAVTVLEVLLRDPATKEPVLFLDTLKVSSIAMEGQSKEIKGGIGAQTLIEYDYGRTVTFEMQDALASIESLAMMWGARYTDAPTDSVLAVIDVVAEADGALALDSALDSVEPEDVKAYNVSTGEVVTISGTAGALKGDVTEGTALKLFVEGPAATAGTQLTVDSIALPPTLELIGRTFFIDRLTGKQMEYQLQIPMLKINMGGGLTMEAEGDAAVFDFSGKALLDPITKELFRLTNTGKEFK